MILLVSSSSGLLKCADLLQLNLGMTTQAVESVRRAMAVLRRESFQAVVIDQLLLDTDPAGVDDLLCSAGAGMVVFVNPAIYGCERVLREVRSAVLRRQHEEASAIEAAARCLRNDLSGDVTGILVSSQLALAEPSLPAGTKSKLQSVFDLAERIRARLETPRQLTSARRSDVDAA
jgi:hypothetical protein